MLFAEDFGTGEVFWSILWFFLFFIWIWILIVVFGDIIRSHDMGGWAKALWAIFIIFVPYLGVFVYLIARGGKMHEHAVQDAQVADAQFRQYVQSAAGTASPADEIARLADLREKGVISDAEFEQAKAKALG
jgi:Short C-terminal domain/Phospholipase_D-nuclease N-terminal